MPQPTENIARRWDISIHDPIPSAKGGKSDLVKFEGTLTEAQEAAVALWNKHTPDRKDVILRIQTMEHGTVSQWTGASRNWETNIDKSQILPGDAQNLTDATSKWNYPGIKGAKDLGCLAVFLLIIAIGGGLYYHNWKIKNYEVSELSESCKKYVGTLTY